MEKKDNVKNNLFISYHIHLKPHTYHLESGKVFFPPDIFLIFGSHGGYHIIKVHHNMYESIQQGEKCTMTTCKKNTKAPKKRATFSLNKSNIVSVKNLQKIIFLYSRITWSEFHSHPNAHWHNTVMNDVQSRHLREFLP